MVCFSVLDVTETFVINALTCQTTYIILWFRSVIVEDAVEEQTQVYIGSRSGGESERMSS